MPEVRIRRSTAFIARERLGDAFRTVQEQMALRQRVAGALIAARDLGEPEADDIDYAHEEEWLEVDLSNQHLGVAIPFENLEEMLFTWGWETHNDGKYLHIIGLFHETIPRWQSEVFQMLAPFIAPGTSIEFDLVQSRIVSWVFDGTKYEEVQMEVRVMNLLSKLTEKDIAGIALVAASDGQSIAGLNQALTSIVKYLQDQRKSLDTIDKHPAVLLIVHRMTQLVSWIEVEELAEEIQRARQLLLKKVQEG